MSPRHSFLACISFFFNEITVAVWNAVHYEGNIFFNPTWVVGHLGLFGILDIFTLFTCRFSLRILPVHSFLYLKPLEKEHYKDAKHVQVHLLSGLNS